MKLSLVTSLSLLALTLASAAFADPPRLTPGTPAVVTGAGGREFGAPLPAGAQFSTKIPANLRSIVLKSTSIQGPVKLNGVTQGDGHWNISVNKGSGPGSQTQSIVLLTNGKIIDKSPVQIEPKHTGTNSDL
jgi:hypothetical protein